MPHRRMIRPVLVVEDDERLRGLYRSLLSEAGFPVVAVGDGMEALRMLEHRVPSAVVLDLSLPRLSGRDVAQELNARTQTRDIPIVVVTGTDGRAIEGVPVACVLWKPVAPEQLVETVERCLRGKRQY